MMYRTSIIFAMGYLILLLPLLLCVCVCVCLWMIFGSLSALCPSCLCCYGDSFISKPECVFVDFVNMFTSGLFTVRQQLLTKQICCEVSRGSTENIAYETLKLEQMNHMGQRGSEKELAVCNLAAVIIRASRSTGTGIGSPSYTPPPHPPSPWRP